MSFPIAPNNVPYLLGHFTIISMESFFTEDCNFSYAPRYCCIVRVVIARGCTHHFMQFSDNLTTLFLSPFYSEIVTAPRWKKFYMFHNPKLQALFHQIPSVIMASRSPNTVKAYVTSFQDSRSGLQNFLS